MSDDHAAYGFVRCVDVGKYRVAEKSDSEKPGEARYAFIREVVRYLGSFRDREAHRPASTPPGNPGAPVKLADIRSARPAALKSLVVRAIATTR